MRQKFGRRLQLSVLFEEPTVAGLARFLSDGDQTPEAAQILVPIRKQGSRPPLFCLHPAGGEVLVYQPLARYLDAEQPVYALQSRATEAPDRELPSLAAMAEHYAQIIRHLQPHGPYQLLGWSMGGVLAVSIARLLEDAGQRVAFVGLLDSYPGGGEATAVRGARARDLIAPELSPDMARAQVALLELHGRMLAAHVPPVIEADLHVWWARDNDHPRADWARHTRGDLTTEVADGTHFTLLREPSSRILYEQIATRLREAIGVGPLATPPPSAPIEGEPLWRAG